MADELTVNIEFSFSKNSRSLAENTGDITIDVTGDKWTRTIQEIGLTEEAIDLGDITAGGMVLAKNLGTGVVSIRRATAEGNAIKLLAGDVALFRFEATAPFAIASVASEVEFVMLEA
jgi:hypothetical protein